jgi:hypothetical protein
LQHIAGVGSSPVINYSGTGAYFIDRISEGAWRLELMPDVIYIRDAFERASPLKQVTAIKWTSNQMEINIAELGEGFSIKGLNSGNSYTTSATGRSFQIAPGTYLLTKTGVNVAGNLTKIGALGINEFVAPASSRPGIIVRHTPFTEVSAGKSFSIRAIIYGIDTARVSVQLTRIGGGLFRNIQMKKSGYEYVAEVPADVVTGGILEYFILVQDGDTYITYPGGAKGNPFDWQNFRVDYYQTSIAWSKRPVELYNPSTDRTVHVLPNFRRGFQSNYVSGAFKMSLVHRLTITDMQDKEVMGMQHFIGDKLKQRISELDSFSKIVIRARTENKDPVIIKIALVDQYGTAYSYTVAINSGRQDIELPLSNFKPDSALLMPRPYPGFQPLYFKSSVTGGSLKLKDIEKLEISTSPAFQSSNGKNYSLEIEKITLN